MALKPRTPAFESDTDTDADVVATASEVIEDTAPAKPAPARPQPPLTLTIPGDDNKPRSAALALSRITSTKGLLDELEGVFDADSLISMSGSFPRVTASNGSLSRDNEDLGGSILVEPISWNYAWVLAAGSDGEAARKMTRVSYDGKMLNDGEHTVDEWLAHMKDEGFEKASVKKYIELYANIAWSEIGGEVPEDHRKMAQISLAPSSVRTFNAYRLQTRVNAAFNRGTESGLLKISKAAGTKGTNKYTFMNFSKG